MDETNFINISEQPKTSDTNICKMCGVTLSDDQEFCHKCGNKIVIEAGINKSYTDSQLNIKNKSKKSSKKIIPIIIIPVVIVALIILFIINGNILNAGVDFQSIYDEYCDSSWADVGSDGSYLSIDTNPSDEDDYFDYDAFSAIEEVNEELGLPESLMDDMESTTALMGKQSEDFEDSGVSVSWSYHPDNGLEVSYKILK